MSNISKSRHYSVHAISKHTLLTLAYAVAQGNIEHIKNGNIQFFKRENMSKMLSEVEQNVYTSDIFTSCSKVDRSFDICNLFLAFKSGRVNLKTKDILLGGGDYTKFYWAIDINHATNKYTKYQSTKQATYRVCDRSNCRYSVFRRPLRVTKSEGGRKKKTAAKKMFVDRFFYTVFVFRLTTSERRVFFFIKVGQ